LKTAILEVSDNLPDPDVIAPETDKMRNSECGIEIIRTKTQLEAVLEQFWEIVGNMGSRPDGIGINSSAEGAEKRS
jgi:hypothetical protein